MGSWEKINLKSFRYNLCMPITTDSVKTYYDQNTNLFLKFNNSKKAQNIHRSLWKDEIENLEDALNFSNSLILKEIESMNINSPRIADLGCGVGASLFYIFPRLQNPKTALGLTLSSVQAKLAKNSANELNLQNQKTALGLTLSSVQAKLAKNSANELNLQNQILFSEGDFTSVPLANESLDAMYSVEAVCHAVEPEKYFREASRLLRKGGKLILVDDYQAKRSFTKKESKWLKAYIDGWYVPGVRTIDQIIEFANKNNLNLIKNEELTPYLRLRNLPDFLASTILFFGNLLPIKHAILPSMLGSMALQQCLYMKIVEYRFFVFEKS